jgi:hypothetical protein
MNAGIERLEEIWDGAGAQDQLKIDRGLVRAIQLQARE